MAPRLALGSGVGLGIGRGSRISAGAVYPT